MKNNVPKITALISIIVIFAVIIWFLAAQLIYRGQNVESTYNEFKRITKKLEDIYLEEWSFKTEDFDTKVKALIKASPRLEALAFYSKDKGIIYMGSTGEPKNLLTEPIDKTKNWKGAPEYSINTLFSEVQRQNFKIPSDNKIAIDGIYKVLNHTDIFPGLIITLSVLGVFLILNIIILLLIPRLEEAEFEYGEEEDNFDDSLSGGLAYKTSEDYDLDQTEENHYTYYEQPLSSEDEYDEYSDEEEEEFDFNIPPEDDLTNIDTSDELPPLSLGDDFTLEDDEEETDQVHRLFSEKSSLGYAEYLPTRLEGELERAASFDQDLLLTILEFKGLEKSQERYREIADIILDSFPFKDLSFEYTENSYALILPNMDLDHGIRKMESFLIKMMHNEEISFPLSIGLSSRNGRLISAKRLISEAKSALNKAISDGGNNIMGFRSDPDRYRKYLLEKKG